MALKSSKSSSDKLQASVLAIAVIYVVNSQAFKISPLNILCQNWIEYIRNFIPDVDMLYHIPNGGKRNEREAAALKRQGVRAGVPDLCLPIAKGKYHGLYIELKYGKNKPTENQKLWIRKLNHYGYATVVCYGWQEAAGCICNYLGIDRMGLN